MQQDLLDTLFLNKKALADVEANVTSGGSQSQTNTTKRVTDEKSNTTGADTTTVSTMNRDVGRDVGAGAGNTAAAECPVDHKSREAWLAQARAAQQSPSPSQSQPESQPQQHQQQQQQEQQRQLHPTAWLPNPFASSSTTTSDKSSSSPPAAEEKCPVDHKSREAWAAHAKAAQEAQSKLEQPTAPAPAPEKQTSAATSESKAGSGWQWPRIPFLSSREAPDTASAATTQTQPTKPGPGLTTNRVISSIPRSTSTSTGVTPSPAGPSNHETETGADPRTGNWVYPSEKMFFDAMKRKGHDTRVADMKTVVPIHNAVNERAWQEIRQWEKPYEATTCSQGPMLLSFTGLSTKMSPRARFNTLLGYTAPFDRHDWVVDRCGTQVEYVIDFYSGRPGAQGGVPSFYLDVRPKLNTWEGVKMRALKGVGLA